MFKLQKRRPSLGASSSWLHGLLFMLVVQFTAPCSCSFLRHSTVSRSHVHGAGVVTWWPSIMGPCLSSSSSSCCSPSPIVHVHVIVQCFMYVSQNMLSVSQYSDQASCSWCRYGYMEAIDHGPLFIKQLVACLLRFVAHQDAQQGPRGFGAQSHPRSTTAALAAAAASGTAAVHPHTAAIHPQEPQGSQAGRGLLGAAAAATPASTRAAGAGGAATGLSAGAGSGPEGGVEVGASKGLERWSRVPTAPTDGTLLDEALATAGKAFVRGLFLRLV
jgi:hypothetical protein